MTSRSSAAPTALLVALCVASGTPGWPLTPELSAALAAAGIREVSPPVPAPDFELPRVGGGRGRLSDQHGRWVVLTLWATWCGPCRAELPSLETVHRGRRAEGMVVVGVSVDRRLEPVPPFVESYALTFPNFWDERGEVGAVWGASTIPVSYLVDPRGYVVAVARGARDWRELGAVLDAALAAQPPGAELESVYAASGTLELPLGFDPPTAEVELASAAPRAGESFTLNVRLHWAGELRDYLPLPPAVVLPEGVERLAVRAATRSRDGRAVVDYRIDLRATEPGRYALDPIEIRFTPRGESEPLATRLAGPTVEVTPRTVAGLRPLTAALGAGALLLSAALALAWGRRRAAVAPAPDRHGALRARFERARAARLRGEVATFLAEIASLEEALGGASESERSALADWLEGARYGGRTPPRADLDQLQRRVERRLDSLREDPERERRARLRLREEETR